jgi:predicted amidohydrolase YtcJ
VKADLVIVNGNIHTCDEGRPRVEALAIRGAAIVAAGSNEEVRGTAGAGTQVIDAGGRLVVPGFNDAHVHLIMGAEELVGVDLRPSRDQADMVGRLERYAAGLPPGEWITGGYWDHEAWPGARERPAGRECAPLPTRDAIDAVTPNHPVFVKRLDGHMAVANSLALTLAGLTDAVTAPPGGVIVRDPAGRITGLVKDAAMDLVTRAIPAPTSAAILMRARAALRHAAELGVTTVQDMTASEEELAAYETLRKAGELTARISSMQNYEAGEQGRTGAATGHGDDWLRIGGRKFFADGSMGANTAAFFDPYADDSGSRGLLMHDLDRLEQLIRDAEADGFQPVVHAIGDRANTLVLDIFERLRGSRRTRQTWRPRIEHAQVVRREDRARFASLGVLASVQPSHCIDDMRWAEARIGHERCATAYNVRSFLDAGARVAFGSDWFVAPLNPMVGLYAAVTRQFPDGTPPGGWFPEERVTLAQAIDCYTRGSAYAELAENRKGMLKQGYLADLVVLSRDIFASPPREILETRPVLTMVGGRVVFDAGQLANAGSKDEPVAAHTRDGR